jgi:hypothetical protein
MTKVQIRGDNLLAATRTARTLRLAGYDGPLTLLLDTDETNWRHHNDTEEAAA